MTTTAVSTPDTSKESKAPASGQSQRQAATDAKQSDTEEAAGTKAATTASSTARKTKTGTDGAEPTPGRAETEKANPAADNLKPKPGRTVKAATGADDGWTPVGSRRGKSAAPKIGARVERHDDDEGENWHEDAREGGRVGKTNEDDRVMQHDYLHCVRTVANLGGDEAAAQVDRIARGSRTVAFHRPMYSDEDEALDWHLMVVTPRVAQLLQKYVGEPKSSNKSGLLAVEPFRLEAEDFADAETERDDTLYLPVPDWLTTRAARKHVLSLLARVESHDMLKPKQFNLIIPESAPNVHKGKCFIKCIVRRQSVASVPGRRPPPSSLTVPPSRLPFVRALLHDCRWPDPPATYEGEEDPNHVNVICRWAQRFANRRSSSTATTSSA